MISKNKLCEISSISRRTIDTLSEGFDIPIHKLGKNNEAFIEKKYIDIFILYIYCTKAMTKILNDNLYLSKRADFCRAFKNKDYRESIRIIEETTIKDLKLLEEIKMVIEEGKIEEQLSIFDKLNNYSRGICDDKVVVVDTSALYKRPDVLNSLLNNFKRVVIPKTVIKELENQKDTRKNTKKQNELKKKANLILNTIVSLGDNLIFTEAINKHNKNDDKIFEVALNEKSPEVYILSEDKVFKLRSVNTKIKTINLEEYDNIFKIDKNDGFDNSKTTEFIEKIKKREIKDLKNWDLSKIDLNQYSAEGFTPLIIAIRNRDVNAVNFLIKQKSIDLNKMDIHKYRLPPISHAVQIKRVDIIKLLVKAGADVNLGSHGVNKNNTPLMISSWNGSLEVVKAFLKQEEICINQVDSNGFTPLIKASIRNHPDIVKLLVSHNADKKIRSFDNKIALDYALENLKKFKKASDTEKYNKSKQIVKLLGGKVNDR